MGYFSRWDKGDWDAICDSCGRKFKASKLKQRWDGLMVCPQDWEIRQPQDFVRGVPDPQLVPWVRDEATDSFVTIPYTEYPNDGITVLDTTIKSFIKNVNTPPYDSTTINGYALNVLALNTVTAIPVIDPNLDDDMQLTESIAVFTGFGKVVSDLLTFTENIRIFKPAPLTINGAVINFGAIN